MDNCDTTQIESVLKELHALEIPESNGDTNSYSGDMIEDAITISKGHIYAINAHLFRVVSCTPEKTILYSLEVKHQLQMIDTSSFVDMIHTGAFTKIDLPPTKARAVSSEEMKKARSRAEMLDMILKETYPRWDLLFRKGKRKPLIVASAQVIGLKPRRVLELLESYLASGCDSMSLVNRRIFNHGVRITERDPQILYTTQDIEREAFAFAFAKFRMCNNATEAYHEMLCRYYKAIIETPEGGVTESFVADHPSYKRVYAYITEHLGGRSVRDYCKGENYWLNNTRPLPGNAQYGINSVGELFEIDEVELDCYIVSDRNPTQTIGKAIVYVAIDVKANICVAIKVGLKNNSYSGLCDLMITLLEPHSIQAKHVQAECDDSIFPSLIMPKAIRCDHGAEYESNALAKACTELGIQLDFVPVATGSLKGCVEGFHHRLQQNIKKALSGAGYIMKPNGLQPTSKVYDEARKNACLTLADMTKIVYEQVCLINRMPLKNYDVPYEMVEQAIPPTPANIYAYEVKNSLDPVNVTTGNRLILLFAWLARCNDTRKFSIGRKGIKYNGHGLRYFVEEEWFFQMINAKDRKTAEIRYTDDRVDCLYVKYHGEIHTVPLSEKRENLATYKGISWTEYDAIYERFAEKSKKAFEQSIIEKQHVSEKIKKIADTAKLLQGDEAVNTKNIKASRADERIVVDSSSAEPRNRLIQEFMQDSKNQTVPDSDVKNTNIETAPVVHAIPNDLPEEYKQALSLPTDHSSRGRITDEKVARLLALRKGAHNGQN